MGLWVVSKKKFDVAKLRLILRNKISVVAIRRALAKDKNGKTRLEKIFDNYGKRSKEPFLDKVKDKPIYAALEIVRRALRIEKEEFKRNLKRPLVRRTILNTFNSLEKYGLTTPQVFVAPLMVVWNFTYKCNLKCKHCYQDAGTLREKGLKVEELTYDEKVKVIDQLGDSNIPTLSFSGGEPLIHPDFWKLAERARNKHDLYISVNTNGTLITEDVAKRLRDAGFAYVAVSVDAATPEVHDAFRGVPGMWEKAIKGIENLVSVGQTTCISYTFTKSNYQELEGMFKLREKLGAYKLVVYNFVPCGRGSFANDPTPQMREEAYAIMYQHLNGKHKDTNTASNILSTTSPQFGRYCKMHSSDTIILTHFGEGKAKELGAIADVIGGCGVGRAYCALQPDGRVTPCVYMPEVTVGNIREKSLMEIWEKSPLLNSLRDRSDLKGHCRNCEYREMCGGCRARAYAYFQDFKAPDPGCINNLNYYKKAVTTS